MPSHNRRAVKSFAEAILNKYYLSDPSQIDLKNILGSERIFYQERNISSSLGSLVRSNNVGQILVNSKIKNPFQKRFIISHELGHWLMHLDIPVFNCDTKDFKNWSHGIKTIEIEANLFAAEFLMPERIFINYIKTLQIDKALFENIGSRFNTSLTASAIRFADCGHESILVTFSQNNVIKWSYPSKDFPFAFYGKDIVPPINSSTSSWFLNNEISDDVEISRTLDWFPNDYQSSESTYLNEIVYPMPSIKGCLTVLWQNEINFQ